MTDPELKTTGLVSRLRGTLLGLTQGRDATARLAVTAFLVRVIGAALAYFAQIMLARWMGTSEYGVYVYVWTWLILLGSMMDFGISVSAQKFVPQYRGAGNLALLRGFLSGSRLLTFGVSAAIALLLAGVVKLVSPLLDPRAIVPFYLGCLTLPAFVLANMQDGIARSHDWMRLALVPQFIVRPTTIIAFTAGAVALGLRLDATAAMTVSAGAVWLAVLMQMLLLDRSLAGEVEPGPKSHDIRGWLATSLPIMMVEGFYLLLSHTDVLVLQFFRPSEDVGIYYAVIKTLALVSFVHYAMSATTSHRFVQYNAAGDRAGLAAYVVHAAKWTFWPSLAATALLLIFGKPLLWLFGPQFTQGYGILFVAAIGPLVRAAIGPVERLLNMLDQQMACARAYALAFVLNLVLCVLLVPRFGGYGAAAALSLALIFETVLLYLAVQQKLGYKALPFGRGM